VLTKKVYVFRTQAGVDAINTGKYNQPFVRTPVNGKRVITAQGYAVPISGIVGIESVEIPDSWFAKLDIRENESTSMKGAKAIKVVKGLLNKGWFPLLPVTVTEVDDTHLQISGTDIHVDLQVKVSIQVKCDYKGGLPKPPGTGNLFLQTAECNPFRQT
jgi:hypothetical protein